MADARSAFEPNTTQVPNFIFDLIPRLSEAELKVLMVIIRKTYGWHKDTDKIAASQLEKLTGLSYSAIKKARASLRTKGLKLIKYKGNGRAITEYCRPYLVPAEEPEESTGSPWGPPGGPGEDTQGGHKEALTKDTSDKRHLEQNLIGSESEKLVQEWDELYFDTTGKPGKVTQRDVQYINTVMQEYQITPDEIRFYMRRLFAEWKSASRENKKFWPLRVTALDGKLFSRIDTEFAADEEETAELMRMGGYEYTPAHLRAKTG